ncbi:hypothetical protein JW992_02810, partial [candidate division KSB1 bacterium]|nr:hypothetical protein [candidate division KSB1 bacterium]
MRRIYGVRIFAGLVALFLLMSCSSSRKADNAVYESGSTSADEPVLTEKNQSGQSDEDEVLRLLGLTPDSKKQESAKVTEPADPVDAEAEIIQLEKTISERDVQLANLKAELAERDRRINDLQSDLEAQPSTVESAPQHTVVSVP